MWPFSKRMTLPPPSPDRTLEVAQVQQDAISIVSGIRTELDRLEATLIRQSTSGVIPWKESGSHE